MQKKLFPIWLVVLILALSILPASVAAKGPSYVSLGTSLAAGHTEHPNRPGSCSIKVKTKLSYTDKIAEYTGLKHKKLGCTGETVESFKNGTESNCNYGAGSQLLEAEKFLRKHGKDTELITIDMGANDVLGCLYLFPYPDPTGGLDSCLYNQIAYVKEQLENEIIPRLQDAAPPGVPIIGMTYYNPLLVVPDLDGPPNEYFMDVIDDFNIALTQAYESLDVYVAEVDVTFESPDWHVICNNTLMCRCNDIHPIDSGYELITDAFINEILDEELPVMNPGKKKKKKK